MKKILSALIITILATSACFANQQAPDKYELGKYNFDFAAPSEPAKVDVAPVQQTQELPQLKQPTLQSTTQQMAVPTSNQPLKPISKKMYSQKEIIDQIKQEEANSQAAEKIKQDEKVVKEEINKIQNATKEDVSKIEQKGKEVTNVTEQKLDTTKVKTEQLLNKQRPNVNKTEKPIKFDKDKPPFMFQIVPIQYDGTQTRTIERL